MGCVVGYRGVVHVGGRVMDGGDDEVADGRDVLVTVCQRGRN